MAWFDDYKERYDCELESLASRGLQFEIDEAQKALGKLHLTIQYPFDNRMVKIVARYPDVFPYFPPEVSAPDERLRRHQHPNGGNLCLIGRRTIQWENDDTIYDLLSQRLELILEFDRTADPAVLEGREEPQGEPVSEYIHGGAYHGSYALYESRMDIPDEVKRGRMSGRWRTFKNHKGVAVPNIQIDEIRDASKTVLASRDGPAVFVGKAINFPWVRVEPAPSGSVQEIVDRIDAGEFDFPGIGNLTERNPADFFAIVYKEEVRLGEYEDAISVFERNWIKRGKSGSIRVKPVRSFRVGTNDLAARMPAVAALSNFRAGVIGLGAVGSPVAVELARNGVGHLSLIDFDFVDPATVRRWALGTSAFGKAKVHALAEHLSSEYPWTRYSAIDLKLGEVAENDVPDQLDELNSIMSQVDLIIDLSAEVAVNHLMYDLAVAHGKKYICASSTPGAWGGLIFQWRPDRDHRCWLCMRSMLYPSWDGLPPADPEGDSQPPGCPARTFTGASFDLAEIALEVVRTAVSVASYEGQYPDMPWQLSVCSMRSNEARTLPTWFAHDVTRRAGCEC